MKQNMLRLVRPALLASIALAAACSGDDDSGTNPQVRELNSGNIAAGGVFVHTFANAGGFVYHCTLHPCMANGTVNVATGQADSALVNITSPGGGCQGAYSPQSVSIRPGGSVRWLNQSVIHTVTSN